MLINLNKGIRKPQACNFRDYLPPSQASSIFLEKATTAEIISIIEEFENDKSSDIPIIVIKHCSTTIVPTLSSLFNKYIESGEVPPVLKIGRISPIYKKDAKDNVKNYRPISTLPIFGKIFEKFSTHESMITSHQKIYSPKHNSVSANCTRPATLYTSQ